MTSPSTMAVRVHDDQSHILPIPPSDNKPLTYGHPCVRWPITHPFHHIFSEQIAHLWLSLSTMTNHTSFPSHFLTTSPSPVAVLEHDDQSHILPIPLSDNKPLTCGRPWERWLCGCLQLSLKTWHAVLTSRRIVDAVGECDSHCHAICSDSRHAKLHVAISWRKGMPAVLRVDADPTNGVLWTLQRRHRTVTTLVSLGCVTRRWHQPEHKAT